MSYDAGDSSGQLPLSCLDRPGGAQAGWGKKLTYVLGFSTAGVRDVTPRYTKRMAALLPRSAQVAAHTCVRAALTTAPKSCVHARHPAGGRRCQSAGWRAHAWRRRSACARTCLHLHGVQLAGFFARLSSTATRARAVSCCRRRLLEARDAEEDAELRAQQGVPQTPQEEALPGLDLHRLTIVSVCKTPGTKQSGCAAGRQTGSVQWRAARGELGNGAAPAAAQDPIQAAVAKGTTETANGAAPQATPARQAAQSAEQQAPAAPQEVAQQPDAAAAESLGRRFKERLQLSPGAAADRKVQLAQRVKQRFAELMAGGKLSPNEAAAAALKWAAGVQ